jgi:beta-galactosidase
MILSVTLVFSGFGKTSAQPRQKIPLNNGWFFYYTYDVTNNAIKTEVTLPHTWDADVPAEGKIDYRREAGTYQKKLNAETSWKNKRLFLYFEGANSVADVFVNQHFVGEHCGGYTAFCIEITKYIHYDRDNLLTVQVSNAYRADVLPLAGDFNIYGGLHRPVSLIITNPDCITPLDYASPGVYITQQLVNTQQAKLSINTKLSTIGINKTLKVKTSIIDAKGQLVTYKISRVRVSQEQISQSLLVSQPHLWNGIDDPYLYKASVELWGGKRLLDVVTQPIGFRSFKVDPNTGFFLNGKHLDLHGLGLHEDVQGRGSAFTKNDYEQDISLVKEIGANALRLTHYPHGQYLYDLCDQNGIILWSEIPLVGPGGYTGYGYAHLPDLENRARQMLIEMIRQNYNRPSICFWGLFNELKLNYDDPRPFLKTLNQLAKNEDGTRLTTCATFIDDNSFNQVSDLIAWNKYFGWYEGNFEDIGSWADATHKKFPNKPFAVSEYGAGASAITHMQNMAKPVPGSNYHPEEWQTLFHECNWEQLKKRPYIWGKFIWVLADFGSALRNEGDKPGINDKGLVTYDRKIKKDAFYFYKANWNTAPMLYLTDKRNVERKQQQTEVKVFTNLREAELFVNGKSVGTKKKDDLNRVIWENVSLRKGMNEIHVIAKNGRNLLEDQCEWELL